VVFVLIGSSKFGKRMGEMCDRWRRGKSLGSKFLGNDGLAGNWEACPTDVLGQRNPHKTRFRQGAVPEVGVRFRCEPRTKSGAHVGLDDIVSKVKALVSGET
jgi:hypothetical protein